jgi:O-antigen/teichoic acid export membrane protein
MARELWVALDQRFNIRQNVLRRLNNRRFWQASGLLMLANVIVTSLALVRTPAMTWLLPKEEVGMLGVVASWLPFLQLASMAGMDSAAYHYVAKGQPWAYVVNLFYRLRWSLISAAGFLAGALYWAWRGDSGLAWMFAITGISYPVTIGMTASAGMLGAQEKFKSLFWYRIFESLTDFTGFIPLAFSAWMISKVVTFYTANQLATAMMQAGVSFYLAWQLKHLGTSPMPEEDRREMVRYGKHLTGIMGISVLQGRTDALLVGTLLPLGTMADYSIGLMVAEQFRRLWTVYVSVRYPPLVRMHFARRRRRFLLEGVLVWLGLIAAGVVVALLAHLLIPIVLPPSYASSLGYMDVLIATVLIGTPGGLAELFFRTQQDARRQYLMRAVSAAVGVVAPILLVFRWGAYGAAAGRFLANLVLSMLGVYLFLRERET